MTTKEYLRNGELTGTAVVTALLSEPAPIVRLDTTLFHAQGGGQRGDRGSIGGALVIDTRHAEGGEVDHFVDAINGLAVGEQVTVIVDPYHREMSARLHSAGHLIADAVHALRPDLHAVAGHHWKGEARVEFEGAIAVEEGFSSALQDKLNELIAANVPITVVGEPFSNRALRIGDFAAVPCGGTHANWTSELAGLKVAGLRAKKGRLRVSYDLA